MICNGGTFAWYNSSPAEKHPRVTLPVQIRSKILKLISPLSPLTSLWFTLWSGLSVQEPLSSDETKPGHVLQERTQCTPGKIGHSAYVSRLQLDQCKKHLKHVKREYQILSTNQSALQISLNRPTLLVCEYTVSGYKDLSK